MASLNSLVSCSYTSRVLTVTSLFTAIVGSGSVILLTVNSVINPKTVAVTDAFVINTYYDSTSPSVIVDQSVSVTYTPSPTVGSATITSNSAIVGASTSLTIRYTVSSNLLTSSLLTVVLPD
jgi:hypothetical protein